MRIKTKFLIGFLVITFAIIFSGIFLSYLISNQLKETALENAENSIGNFVKNEANDKLDTNDFISINFEEKEKVFAEFFNNIDTEDIVRIKVWSKDGTIIYSDDKTIVGQNYYNDNEEFQEALRGEVSAEIKEPVKPENISELGYGQLMEVYVPVYLTSDIPVGVIETYFILDEINASITKTNELIFLTTFVTLAIIITVVIIVYHIFSKTVITQIIKLRDAANEIAKENFDYDIDIKSKDEVGQLANHFNAMREKLKLIYENQKYLLAKSKEELEKFKHIKDIAEKKGFDVDTK